MKPETDSPSRRRIITAGAAAIGATAVAVPVAMAGAPIGNVDALWAEFASLGPKLAAAEERIASATKALPAWAAPGPKYIRGDGALCGDIVDDPLDTAVEAPEGGGKGIYHVLRVSLADVQRQYQFFFDHWPANAKTTRKEYVARLRELARLRMDQKIERKKVGLPELEAEREALVDRRYDVAWAILNIAENSANAVAAKIIVGALIDDRLPRRAVTVDDLGDMTSALTALQPSLSGKIAVDVADLLKCGDA